MNLKNWKSLKKTQLIMTACEASVQFANLRRQGMSSGSQTGMEKQWKFSFATVRFLIPGGHY